MKTRVHKLTVYVVDHDQLGGGEAALALQAEGVDVHPTVDTVEIDWSEDHPVNQIKTRQAEFDRLFSRSSTSRDIENIESVHDVNVDVDDETGTVCVYTYCKAPHADTYLSVEFGDMNEVRDRVALAARTLKALRDQLDGVTS